VYVALFSGLAFLSSVRKDWLALWAKMPVFGFELLPNVLTNEGKVFLFF